MTPSTGGGTKISWLLLASSSWECNGRHNRSTTKKMEIGLQRKQSGIDFPIEIRKNVVSPFAIFQEFLVNRSPFQLIVEACEPQEMILGPFTGVVSCGPGLHQKRPVT